MPYKSKTHHQLLQEQGVIGKRVDKPDPTQPQRIRNSSRWQNFRGWFRRRHPVCCDPLGLHPGVVEPTGPIHHIIPLSERPDLACVESNCAGMCTPCHGQIEALERKGKPTQHLFRKD